MEILGILGRQNSGKTTLITKLVPALKSLGLRVSTVKHSHHGFEIDTPGKDTFRHRESGAEEVMFASKQRWVLMRELGTGTEPPLEDLIAHMTPVDLVLVEGFKTLPLAKIEVRAPENTEPTLQSGDEHVVAVVGDQNPEISVPTFGRDDIGPISDFIAARVPKP
jgi:molybdopterin-guanine dinucleotide biosynthesis protein B